MTERIAASLDIRANLAAMPAIDLLAGAVSGADVIEAARLGKSTPRADIEAPGRPGARRPQSPTAMSRTPGLTPAFTNNQSRTFRTDANTMTNDVEIGAHNQPQTRPDIARYRRSAALLCTNGCTEPAYFVGVRPVMRNNTNGNE